MGKEVEINSIEIRFYNAKGSWIYLPRNVKFSLFDWEYQDIFDGGIGQNILPETKFTSKSEMGFKGISARYIKLNIINYGTIPEGKQGAGNKAWTFIDEIIVN